MQGVHEAEFVSAAVVKTFGEATASVSRNERRSMGSADSPFAVHVRADPVRGW